MAVKPVKREQKKTAARPTSKARIAGKASQTAKKAKAAKTGNARAAGKTKATRQENTGGQSAGWRRVIITVSLFMVLSAASLVLVLSHGIDKELYHVSATTALRQHADRILLNLIEMDSAERAFTATRAPEHYQRFFRASQALNQQIGAIEVMVQNGLHRREQLAELRKGIETHRNLLTQRMMTVQQQPGEQAYLHGLFDNASYPPGSLSELIAAFLNEEEQDLTARRQWLDQLRTGLTVTALVAIISAFVLAIAVINRFRRDVRRLHKRQSRLSSENAVLEQRVKDRTAELETARAYAEKERQRVESLLQDSSHRIGNSLATVSSLLGLQMQRSRNTQVRAALSSARDRIHTISAAHRRLRLGEDMETASAGEFLNAVVHDVQAGLSADQRERIRFRTRFEAWHLAARDVTTLGIILGELLTNAVKHAFPKGKSGIITISFGKMDNDILQLVVEDNGIGCDGIIEEDAAEYQGLGQLVVSQLCMQFGDKPHFERGKKRGTKVVIPLPALVADKINEVR